MKAKIRKKLKTGIFSVTVVLINLVFNPLAVFSKTTIKLAHVCTESDIFHIQSLKFKELVEKRTDKDVEIRIYPNKQLGSNESDLINMVQMGTIGLAVITSGPISTYVPAFGVLDMPFLFESKEQAYKVLDGPIGKRFLDSLAAINIKGLAFGERGMRNVSNNLRPILNPEDLRGLKIRVMQSAVYIDTFKALGANPVPMGWGDVYTALQQGTIDAQENPPWVIEAFKIYEVQKFYSLTGHSYAGNVIMMNKQLFDGLMPATQKILKTAAMEASAYERRINKEGVTEILKRLRDKGMQINDLDRASFQSMIQPVYEEAYKKSPEWRQYISEIRSVR